MWGVDSSFVHNGFSSQFAQFAVFMFATLTFGLRFMFATHVGRTEDNMSSGGRCVYGHRGSKDDAKEQPSVPKSETEGMGRCSLRRVNTRVA